jgi:hypothetical protein
MDILYIFVIFIIIYIILSYLEKYKNKKRNLIYICFTGKPYLELGKLLIRSIDTFLSRDDVDILIVTSPETMILYKNWLYNEWKPRNKNINFLYSITNEPFHLYRFILNDIFKSYNKILYLDTDILIASKSINNLFDENLDKNTLYVIQESKNHNGYEHSFQDKKYTTSQQLELQQRNIYPFNNGQFMFRYSPEMKNHFDNIINIIKSRPYDLFIDQQTMNVYFNNNFLSKPGTIDKYTKLFAKDHILENYKNITESKYKCIMHFCGDIHNGEKKEDHMLQFLKLNKITLN